MLYYNCSKGTEIKWNEELNMTREWIAEKLNEWIDHDHDFSKESINDFCNTYANSYDEYMALWYEVCGCIEED